MTSPDPRPLTPEERVQRGRRVIDDLCQGRLRWEMRVPAEPDHDPDLILTDALNVADELLAERTARDGGGTTYISDKMVLGARCLNCGADAMDHSCIEAAPTPATPDEWHFDPRCAWHDPGIAAKDLRPQECEHFPAAPPACGHGALIDGDNNCPDCGAPVIYRERAARAGDGLRAMLDMEARRGTRPVLVGEGVFDAARTDDGRVVTVDWGEPDEHGFYTPTFTAHDPEPEP